MLMHGLGTDDGPGVPGMHEAAAMGPGPRWPPAGPSGRRRRSTGRARGRTCTTPWPGTPAGSASKRLGHRDPGCPARARSGSRTSSWTPGHGDGVERAFWNDPRVLTIGLHEHPETLFPGTGYPTDTGGPHAEGSAVNIALPALTGDAGWLRAFHAVVPPLLRQFRPQILVSQHGCDSHRDDPLTNLELTIDAQRIAHAAIHRLAHEHAGGRWLLTGGGGYEHVHVVPRSWTHLLFEAAGLPLDPASATPGLWREYVSAGDQPGCPGNDDRRRPGRVRRLRNRRPRSGRPRRPGHHGHPEGRLPPARPHALSPVSAPAADTKRCRVAPERRQRGIHLDGQGRIASAAVLRRDDEDRAVRVLGDLAGHRTHHQPGEPARAPRAQDDHVGVLARVDELLDREAVDRRDRDRVRAGPVQPGQHLVGLGLGRLAGLLGPFRIIRRRWPCGRSNP